MTEQEKDFNFKDLFVPLTTFKAIHFIVIIGLIVYFNSLFNGFVWDDYPLLVNNLRVHSITNIFDIITAKAPEFKTQLYYRPLPEIFYSIIYAIFGATAFFFHLFQIILHISIAILLFILFLRFFKNYLALLLSAVFLIHPFNSESVLYISGLQTNLMLVLGLIAILISLNKPILTIKNYLFIFSLILLSILSKESGVIFIMMIFVSRCIFFRKTFKKDGVFLIYFTIATLLIYLTLRFAIAKVIPGDYITAPIPIMTSSLQVKLLTIPKILWFYFSNFFYPKNLLISQHWIVYYPSLHDFYLPLLYDLISFILVFILGVHIFRKNKSRLNVFLFFLIFFIINLSLNLQIFPLDMTVADRWFYAPMIGMLGLLGLGLNEINLHKNKVIKFFFITLSALALLSLSIRTIIRSADWKNELTLYSHDELVNKDSFELENLLGRTLIKNGDLTEAFTHLARSTQLAPLAWEPSNNLGVLYVKKENLPLAKQAFKNAIKANSSYLNAYDNLSITMYKLDNASVAKEWISGALEKFPNDYNLWNMLAFTEAKLGHKTVAMEYAKKAYLLVPNELSKYIYTSLSKDIPLKLNLNL